MTWSISGSTEDNLVIMPDAPGDHVWRIELQYSGDKLKTAGISLLYTIAEYIDSISDVADGETFGYGYWHVLFKKKGDVKNLVLYELNEDWSKYVAGANTALRYWTEQHQICRSNAANFAPPNPKSLAAVSAGVFEGLPVQCVRYAAPDHMSGWYITTSQYDGDYRKMKLEHMYHVTAARPELAKYIALPIGFRVNQNENGCLVMYDREVASSPAE